jgi:hypothetical protein
MHGHEHGVLAADKVVRHTSRQVGSALMKGVKLCAAWRCEVVVLLQHSQHALASPGPHGQHCWSARMCVCVCQVCIWVCILCAGRLAVGCMPGSCACVS